MARTFNTVSALRLTRQLRKRSQADMAIVVRKDRTTITRWETRDGKGMTLPELRAWSAHLKLSDQEIAAIVRGEALPEPAPKPTAAAS